MAGAPVHEIFDEPQMSGTAEQASFDEPQMSGTPAFASIIRAQVFLSDDSDVSAHCMGSFCRRERLKLPARGGLATRQVNHAFEFT